MDLRLTIAPVAKVGMLIRKPALATYEAFVNPDISTKFWFTHSTGRLEVGKRLYWEWSMYGVISAIEVKKLEPGKYILLEWGLDDQPSTVEWTFTPHGTDTTFVEISNYGFSGDGDTIVSLAKGSEAGFALVLAGLKAYLEYGVNLNLIADRFPERIESQH